MEWFILKCGKNPHDECNYTKVDIEPSCCGNKSICAVKASADEHDHPILTEGLKNEMSRALIRRKNTQHVRLHSC